MDSGQWDEISFMVMDMDTDDNNKVVEIIFWALMTPI
jgi:hypothetical protein